MGKVNRVKLGIDLIMVVAFVLLFDHLIFGGSMFHEIVGLAIYGVVVTHLLLNARWVKSVTLKVFSRKLPNKTRISYFLNVLLFVCVTFIVFSGVVISKSLFPGINLGNEMWFKLTHTSVSFFSLIIIGIHLGLNWPWVMNQVKNLLGIQLTKTLLQAIVRIAVITILIFGSYQIYATSFVSKLAGLSMVVNPGQMQMLPAKDRGPDDGQSFAKGQPPPRVNRSETGQAEGRPERGARHPEGRGLGAQRSGSAATVLNYLSIMGVGVIITYYLDKLVRRKGSLN